MDAGLFFIVYLSQCPIITGSVAREPGGRSVDKNIVQINSKNKLNWDRVFFASGKYKVYIYTDAGVSSNNHFKDANERGLFS